MMEYTRRTDIIKLEGTIQERLRKIWDVRATLLREYFEDVFPVQVFETLTDAVSGLEIAYVLWDTSSQYDDEGGYYDNVDEFEFYGTDGQRLDISTLDNESNGEILGDLEYWDFISHLQECFENEGVDELKSYCSQRVYNPKYLHLKESLEATG